MKGRLAVILLLATAAGVHAQSPAPASWFDLPLAGGTRTLAALGVEPAFRAEMLPRVARMLYGQDSGPLMSRGRLAVLLRESAAAPPGDEDGVQPVVIPVPLTRQAWQQLLELKAGEDLSARLLSDRAATLVAAGLVETDTSIRALLTARIAICSAGSTASRRAHLPSPPAACASTAEKSSSPAATGPEASGSRSPAHRPLARQRFSLRS